MAGVPDDAPVYSMAVAEEMTGLTRRRIRYYEKMRLLSPARTPGNRRLFSAADIRRLSGIKRLLDEGLDLQAIVSLNASGRLFAPERPTWGVPAPSALGLARLEQYEDARARLLGKGPAGGADRLYPGDAGRLTGIRKVAAPKGSGLARNERGK